MKKLIQQLRKTGYKGKLDLSSLIDACGDKFGSLYLDNYSHKFTLKGGKWVAVSKNSLVDGTGSNRGKIPEDSVAKLWLKLQ